MADPDGPGERPEIWVNCAASADGRLAFAGGARARLSSPEDLARVQTLRADVDGVVVGVGTVLADNPSLTVHWELLGRPPAREPTRVILDGRGRTPVSAKVLDRSAPTIVVVADDCPRRFDPPVRTLAAGPRPLDIAETFRRLRALGLRRLLVEGGSEVLASVLRSRQFDRWTVYVAPVVIGALSAPPMIAGPAARSFDEVARLRLDSVERLGEGYLATYRPPAGDRPAPLRP